MTIDYTPRERAALGGEPGICRALDPERTYMCDLDEGHDGDHHGFELPTITLDEGEPCQGCREGIPAEIAACTCPTPTPPEPLPGERGGA
jgi:hypothetical protein